MFKWLLLFLALCSTPAVAQGNPQCPTRPVGDVTNACASTAFVNAAIGPIATPVANSVFVTNGSSIPGWATTLPTGLTIPAPAITGAATAVSLAATAGIESSGGYTGAYSDGIIVDYTSGTGRISVGTSDGFAWYNGGLANTQIASLSAAGVYSPSGGVAGVTNGVGAATGIVGEVITSGNVSSVSMTNATAKNITSVTLSAGDWNCFGNYVATPAATTTQSLILSSISLTTGAVDFASFANIYESVAVNIITGISPPEKVINISTPTTVYLVATSSFATSTLTGGGILSCRRLR